MANKKQVRPRVKTRGLRERAWWLIRKNKQGTLVEICGTLNDGAQKNPAGNLRKWLNCLVKAGIMKRETVDDGKLTSNGSYRFVLTNNIGPKAPVVKMDKGQVYNPNNGETYHINGDAND